MTTKLFADSGFFIGLIAENDDHHQESEDIFQHLKDTHLISDLNDLYITNYIIMEVLHGLAKKGLQFDQMVVTYEKLKLCHLRNVRPNHIDEAIKNKLQFRNRKSNKAKIGFVDATSLVIMDKQNIDCIISFDSDFDNLPEFYTRIYNNNIIDRNVLGLWR
jgi:predicted nucleic acid-binding protein